MENSQLGVFLGYAGESGRALIDRELYLPESWITDADRCEDAGIPADRVTQGVLTKPRLAEAMIGRALAAGVEAGWVAADSAYGRDGRFRAFLESRRMPYVVEVPVKQTVPDLDGKRRVAPSSPAPWPRPGIGSRPVPAFAVNGSTTGLGLPRHRGQVGDRGVLPGRLIDAFAPPTGDAATKPAPDNLATTDKLTLPRARHRIVLVGFKPNEEPARTL